MSEENEAKTCAQCRHFRRHYVCEGGRRFVPLNQGHCGALRIRDKDADTPAIGRCVAVFNRLALEPMRKAAGLWPACPAGAECNLNYSQDPRLSRGLE